MTMRLSPGCNCCGGDSPCCCCFQSINFLFKKDGVTIKTIEVPIESLVFEEITIGGGPGTRCTYTTSFLTTCPSGRKEPGYVDFIPIMERSFNSDYCAPFFPNTIYFEGVEVWKTNYVIRSITVQLTCSATQKRLTATIDGFYEMFQYAESGLYQVIRQSDCVVLFEDSFSGVEVETGACSFLSSATIPTCLDVDSAEVRNPYQFFSARKESDLAFDTDLITATCQELVDDFEAIEVWLGEYSSSTLNMDECSMPTNVRGETTVSCDCGNTVKNFDFQFRTNAEREDEIIQVVPEITLC